MKYIIEYTVKNIIKAKSVFFNESEFKKEIERLQNDIKYSNISFYTEEK